MTDQSQEKLGGILGRCAKDPAFRARFKSSPAAVLAENGIEVPKGVNVHVVENTAHDVYVTLPPAAGSAELSEAELEQVAGGGLSLQNKQVLVNPKIWISVIQQYTKSAQSGSTCYKDCIPW